MERIPLANLGSITGEGTHERRLGTGGGGIFEETY